MFIPVCNESTHSLEFTPKVSSVTSKMVATICFANLKYLWLIPVMKEVHKTCTTFLAHYACVLGALTHLCGNGTV